MSESLGLSRNGLREAVKALELIRVLDVRRGDGTYVTSLEPALLLEAVAFVVDMHHDRSIIDLLEVRRILEPASAVLATARASEREIEELATLMQPLGEDTNVEDLVAHDLHFHSAIATISAMSTWLGCWRRFPAKRSACASGGGLMESGSVQRTLDEHEAIVDAIRRRDPQLVNALVAAHVEGVERWVRSSTKNLSR